VLQPVTQSAFVTHSTHWWTVTLTSLQYSPSAHAAMQQMPWVAFACAGSSQLLLAHSLLPPHV
jgi:hypothetical protein